MWQSKTILMIIVAIILISNPSTVILVDAKIRMHIVGKRFLPFLQFIIFDEFMDGR